MANLKGLASFVSELRVERTSLVDELGMLMRLFQFWARWAAGVITQNRSVGCQRRLASG
jgi:hypothetical protein